MLGADHPGDGFDKAGKHNSNADALSRNPCPSSSVSAVAVEDEHPEDSLGVDTIELCGENESDSNLLGACSQGKIN